MTPLLRSESKEQKMTNILGGFVLTIVLVPMGALAQQLYRMWSAQGAGAQDFSSIINLIKRAS